MQYLFFTFIVGPTVQKVLKSVKIWQSYSYI